MTISFGVDPITGLTGALLADLCRLAQLVGKRDCPSAHEVCGRRRIMLDLARWVLLGLVDHRLLLFALRRSATDIGASPSFL